GLFAGRRSGDGAEIHVRSKCILRRERQLRAAGRDAWRESEPSAHARHERRDGSADCRGAALREHGLMAIRVRGYDDAYGPYPEETGAEDFSIDSNVTTQPTPTTQPTTPTTPPPSGVTGDGSTATGSPIGGWGDVRNWDADTVKRYYTARGVTPNATSP